jgi:hypothetical protein
LRPSSRRLHPRHGQRSRNPRRRALAAAARLRPQPDEPSGTSFNCFTESTARRRALCLEKGFVGFPCSSIDSLYGTVAEEVLSCASLRWDHAAPSASQPWIREISFKFGHSDYEQHGSSFQSSEVGTRFT